MDRWIVDEYTRGGRGASEARKEGKREAEDSNKLKTNEWMCHGGPTAGEKRHIHLTTLCCVYIKCVYMPFFLHLSWLP